MVNGGHVLMNLCNLGYFYQALVLNFVGVFSQETSSVTDFLILAVFVLEAVPTVKMLIDPNA